jgi:hypothetical protein
MFVPVIILTLFWHWSFATNLNAADADVLWTRAVSMAQQGQVDMAFTNFRMIVDSYPTFSKGALARLDVAEYYFLQNDLHSAVIEFENLCLQYPKGHESFIALAYLYKIAQMQGKKEDMALYQKRLMSSHPFALIFKNNKSFEVVSGFHKYKAMFQIDKIEVWIDDRLFVQIPS